MIVEKLLAAFHLRTYDPEARAARIRRAEQLELIAKELRTRYIIESDQRAQDALRRRHHGEH